MPTASAPKEYRARTDARKRLTLRGAASRDYQVLHRNDGSILLKPLVAGEAEPVSKTALRGMDKAIENHRAGKRSKPADLEKYARFAK